MTASGPKKIFIEEDDLAGIDITGQKVRIKDKDVLKITSTKRRYREIKHLAGRVFTVKSGSGYRMLLDGVPGLINKWEISGVVI